MELKIEIDGNDSLSVKHKEEMHMFHKSMHLLISSILNNSNNNNNNNNNKSSFKLVRTLSLKANIFSRKSRKNNWELICIQNIFST